MFGVSSRVVLKSALTEPELEIMSGLLNDLIKGGKQKLKKFVFHRYIFLQSCFVYCKHIYTNMFQRERKCHWGKA